MEENNNNGTSVQKKERKAKITVITLCVIAILLIGLQVYASTNNYGNAFFLIKDLVIPKNASGEEEMFIEGKIEEKENAIEENENKVEENTKHIEKNEVVSSKNNENSVKKENKVDDKSKINEAYNKFIGNYKKGNGEIKTTNVDIDKDGINELLIVQGESEAEKMIAFYTYKDGQVKELGTLGLGHSFLYKMNNYKYILQVYGHGGYEEVSKIYIKDGKIQKDLISEREIKEGESYKEGDVLLKELFDIVQYEPDNYAEEVIKDEIKQKLLEYVEEEQKNGEIENFLDFKIDKVELVSEETKKILVENYGDDYREDDYLAYVRYSIKPQNINNTKWIAGNGKIEGEWVNDKMTCVVLRDGKILGFGATAF